MQTFSVALLPAGRLGSAANVGCPSIDVDQEIAECAGVELSGCSEFLAAFVKPLGSAAVVRVGESTVKRSTLFPSPERGRVFLIRRLRMRVKFG